MVLGPSFKIHFIYWRGVLLAMIDMRASNTNKVLTKQTSSSGYDLVQRGGFKTQTLSWKSAKLFALFVGWKEVLGGFPIII